MIDSEWPNNILLIQNSHNFPCMTSIINKSNNMVKHIYISDMIAIVLLH